MSDVASPSRRYRALIQLLRTAEDLWNASRVFFARWELSPSQFNLLNLLYGQPDGLSQSDLSRLLIMHRSNATGLVDRLEHRGLVQRRDDPDDRRAYRVVLTDPGNRLLEQIYPHYFAAADRVWANTAESRVEQLLGELKDLADHAAAVAGAEAAVAQMARDAASLPRPRRPRAARQVPAEPVASGNAPTPSPPPPPEGGELRISDL